MSYQGYVEFLCEDGHADSNDCFDDTPKTCPIQTCGKPIVWWNDVDETNGEGDQFRAKLVVVNEAEHHTCSCGNVHTVKPAQYKIPDDVGHKGTPQSVYAFLQGQKD